MVKIMLVSTRWCYAKCSVTKIFIVSVFIYKPCRQLSLNSCILLRCVCCTQGCYCFFSLLFLCFVCVCVCVLFSVVTCQSHYFMICFVLFVLVLVLVFEFVVLFFFFFFVFLFVLLGSESLFLRLQVLNQVGKLQLQQRQHQKDCLKIGPIFLRTT